MDIEAKGLDHKALNEAIRAAGPVCRIRGCMGQRFIGAGMSGRSVEIDGVPGNALGAYLGGGCITVHGNAQDAVGDTMNSGSIIIRGSVGDTAGYAMRGGEIYVQGNAGYRVGIHMKAYREQQPVIVIGGRTGSFLGEYQAGGTILVLGLHTDGKPIAGYFPCTGQHGGRVIFRGDVSALRFPPQVTPHPASEEELALLRPRVERWCALFGGDAVALLQGPFTVATPDTGNPYRQMYAAN